MSAPNPGQNQAGDLRASAARALVQVVTHGVSIGNLGTRHLDGFGDSRDRALVGELIRGVARWWFRYQRVLDGLLDRPLKERDSDLRMLLFVGLHQLLGMRIPDHAAVAATVSACESLRKGWAKGLINATLRNAIRRREDIERGYADDPVSRYSHPAWLVAMLRADWPEDWERILAANNEPAPMTLRVNTRRITRTAYRDLLNTRGLAARDTQWSDQGLLLQAPVDVGQLPGFDDGLVSVQDEAAQLAARLLDPAEGDRVLDACAAPGGKLAHLIERQPKLIAQAVESDPTRAERLRQTRERLGLDFAITVADVTRTDRWWDGQPFDAILADVPCSGTGVIRRQPDIKLHRQPEDIDRLTQLQQAILETLWSTLKPGGKLLYATCSVLRVENDDRITQLGLRHADLRVRPPDSSLACGRATRQGMQLLPGDHDMDGFYYACLIKNRD